MTTDPTATGTTSAASPTTEREPQLKPATLATGASSLSDLFRKNPDRRYVMFGGK